MYSYVHLKRGSFCFCSVGLALSNEPALCLPCCFSVPVRSAIPDVPVVPKLFLRKEALKEVNKKAVRSLATVAILGAGILSAPGIASAAPESPAVPDALLAPPAPVTEQVTKDSSALPVIWVGGSTDFPQLNSRVRTYIERSGMKFFEWDPIMVTLDDPDVKLFDHLEKYMPSLDSFVKQVLQETGAPKVNLVTYSQGGAITAGWTRMYDGAKVVEKIVNISGLVNGSPVAGVGTKAISEDCLGFGTCVDFIPEGEYVRSITEQGNALPGIEYLNVESRMDLFAAPYTNGLMTGPGNYRNVLTEDLCPGDVGTHLLLPQKQIVHQSIVQFFRGQEVRPACR